MLIFLICGIIPYFLLWILCNAAYKKQASDLLNVIHTGTPGALDPMLKFTPHFGNIKFRGFVNLVVYIILGVIDYFVTVSWLNFIFSCIVFLNVFNSFTLITSLRKSFSFHESYKHSGRFLNRAYIYHFIFNIILYIAYIIIF